jgi:hypothetical protein
MLNAVLDFPLFLSGDVSFVRQEDGARIKGPVLLVCWIVDLFGGSGGCAIAVVALVTINEDQDHFLEITSVPPFALSEDCTDSSFDPLEPS